MTPSSGGTHHHLSKYTRQQHLDSYLQDPLLNRSTRKVSHDDTTYDTVFQTKDQYVLILRVYMATSTNMNVPAPKMMLVSIRATHDWLDGKMRVIGYRPIQNEYEFAKSGLSLSQAINNVVQHFQLYPPRNIVILDDSLNQLQTKQHSMHGTTTNTGTTNSSSVSNHHSNGSMTTHNHSNPLATSMNHTSSTFMQKGQNLPPHFSQEIRIEDQDLNELKILKDNMHIPSIPKSSTELNVFENMNHDELNEILDDHDKLLPHLEHVPCVIESEELVHNMLESNIKRANENLTHEETLKELYGEIQELQESLKEKVKNVKELQAKQIKLSQPMDVNEIIYQLRIAKRESMDESEELASDWLHCDDTEAKVDEFLKEFIMARTIHHVRAAKMERLEELQRNQRRY